MFTHSAKNCNAKTYKTKCIYCGRTVYFFSCDCGSKIYFDELGGNWKRHYCEEYIQYAIKTQGSDDLFDLKKSLAQQIEIDYANINIEPDHINDEHIMKINPALEKIQDIGFIKNIKTNIDIFKYSNENKTDFNIISLNGIDYQNLCLLTIQVKDRIKKTIEEYECFIEKAKLSELSINDEVEFSIRGKSIFFNITVWIIDEIYPL